MRNLKKLLAVMVLALLTFALTACSELNKVTNYFEEQGFVRYQYNGIGESVLFSVHDALVDELDALTTVDTSTTTMTTTDFVITTTATTGSDTTTTTVTTEELGFASYVFSNGEYAVLVMEFQTTDLLYELLETTVALQEQFEGLDQADYINGNCLLIVLDGFMDRYDDFVEIFQGRADHQIFTTTTVTVTTVSSTETTTTGQ